MTLPQAFRALFPHWREPRPTEPEPCSDWTDADGLDAKLALRKAHRVAERSMRGRG